MHLSRRLLLVLAAAGLVATTGPARAQDARSYPSAPIRIIISTPAGGGNDVLARLVGQKLTAAWGQPVIVEAKPGASGLIAATAVAKAAPDGHTLLVTHAAIATAVALKPNANFRLSDLAAVSQLANTPIAFTVSTSTGAASLAEFIKSAKANPKKYSFGSYGAGTSAHILGELLNRRAGIDLLHVPYKGEAPAILDLIGGQVTSVFGSAGSVEPHARAGKVKVVAFANPRRVAAFPEVPTFSEAGFPELNLPGWIGVLAPAATPRAIVDKLSAEIAQAVRAADVTQKIVEMGYEPTGTSAAAFTEFLGGELRRWEAAGKETGITID